MKFLNYLPVILNNNSSLKEEFTVGDQSFKMVVRMNGQDAEYFTNVDCIVHSDFKNWKKGDKVFVKYNEMREVIGAYSEGKNTRVIYHDGQEILMINPLLVYLTIRDGELIPNDGFSLVLPVKEEKLRSDFVILLESEEDKYRYDTWEVVAVGGPSHISEKAFGTDAIPKVGDIVYSKLKRGVPLEAALNKKLDKNYYTLRHNEVLGYEVRK